MLHHLVDRVLHYGQNRVELGLVAVELEGHESTPGVLPGEKDA